MDTIRYVHAADLHLDTPFSSLARINAHLAEELRNATFTALERLGHLCTEIRPDFLLIAGDIYNQEERSIKAQLKLREVCSLLDRHDIPVFIVHGNHDPISSRLSAIAWPDNTLIFGELPQHGIVEKNGKKMAVVHGISHAAAGESRNLARMIHRLPGEDCFQIGLLHCNVDGAVAQDHYSPCSLADLQATGLDAWALGHAHRRRILAQMPFIAYSGNTQGLHHGETGPKGCLAVTATRKDKGWECKADFHALGPVQWEQANVALDGCQSLDEIENRLVDSLPPPAIAKAVILDVVATGQTPLWRQLNTEAAKEEFTGLLQSAAPPEIFIRSLSLAPQSPLPEEENPDRDDLLGEIWRVCDKMAQDPALLDRAIQKAIMPLKKASRGLIGNPEYPQELLKKAARVCRERLEDR